MSYILDALKKSDQERKQGDIPNLQTVHVSIAQEQNKPWLLYGMLLVLLLALAFVIGFLMSEKNEKNQKAGAEIEKIIEPVYGNVPPATLSEQSEVKNKIHEAEPVSNAVVVSKSETIKAVSEPVQEKSSLVEQSKTEAVMVPENLSDIPFLHELPAYQQQLIPEMSFAGHVYSSAASSRSVIINGNAMSEGDTLLSGMTVEQITSNGVVVRFNDVVFRVDVLQDWSFE